MVIFQKYIAISHYFVAICYKKGIVLCEQFLGRMNGASYSEFVHNYFPGVFANANNCKGKIILQDGDPVQNCKEVYKAYDEIGCRIFSIPARSPDINPIENVFNNIRVQLRTDAVEKKIESETYEQFCERVKTTLLNYSREIIDRTIESMPNRMKLILQGKGCRTKY